MGDLSNEQQKVDSLLRWGVVFSLIWLAGLGSLISIRNGLKTKGMMRDNPELIGKIRVWWCLIVGGLGLLLWIPILFIGIINNLT